MTAFPKYSHYKDSGVEWLGEVPEHWGVERLKGSLLEVDSRSTTGTETLLSLRMNVGLVPHNDVSTLLISSTQLIGYKKVAPGQVVMNRMRASSGIFAVATSHGLVSPDYAVFESKGKQGADYLLSLFKTGEMMTEFRRYSTGLGTGESGFLRLYSNNFFNIRCPIPPKAEEDRIVAFLDEKTKQIDTLIAKKQRQIELLEEQKAILINLTVTRGLNPHAELQAPGIEWINSIPKGWKVIALRYLLSEPLTNGLFKTKQFYGEGTRLVNVGDVYAQDNVITPSSLERVAANSREKAAYKVLKGDIFFVRSSLKLEGTGASSMMPDCDEETVFECHVIRGRPKPRIIEPEFLIRYLNAASVRSALVAQVKTVTMSTLDQQAFLCLPILVPPKEEQEAICHALRATFEKFNQAKSQIEYQIQALQTLRNSLIAHAVTGKIKV